MMLGTKRQKVGGSAISNEVKEELNLLKNDTPLIFMAPPREKNGQKIYKSSSKQNNTANGRLSLAQITNLLCPEFSYKRVGFGNQWRARQYDVAIPDPLLTSFNGGTDKAIYINPGKQYWGEYMIMPAYNPGQVAGALGDMAFPQDGFTCTIIQLVNKAIDTRNENGTMTIARNTTQPQFYNPGVSPTSSGMTIGQLKGQYGISFEYHGGYQEHTWHNVSPATVTIYITECQPRSVMSQIRSVGSVTQGGITKERFRPILVGDSVLSDYKANLPVGNTYKPHYTSSLSNTNNASTDALDDPHVRINAYSNQTHYRYKCSKEIKITIAPGDKYTHKVAIDPFSFTESSWNKVMNTHRDHAILSTGNDADFSTIPMIIPAISKMLVVRMTTEIGWLESQDAQGNGMGVQGVGLVPATVLHTCTEYHKARMFPYNFERNHFFDYNLDQTANRIMNNETDEAEIIGNSGTAADSTGQMGL